MIKHYEVIFTPRAVQQLDRLYSYIATRGGAARAEHFTGRIVAECESLSTFPERGTKRYDIRPNLRVMGFERRASIAFSVNTANRIVAIHGIFYGGQDYEAVLRE